MENPVVLVVDDENFIRENIAKFLNLNKINTFVACEGGEALKIYQNNKIDLVLTDLNMPNGMDGFSLIKQIQKINPAQKIIVMSGFVENEQLIGEEYPFVQKPFSSKDLVAKIKKILA
jgi:YesN/AraC family two-component response regulator